jgi:hypothetical protein
MKNVESSDFCADCGMPWAGAETGENSIAAAASSVVMGVLGFLGVMGTIG